MTHDRSLFIDNVRDGSNSFIASYPCSDGGAFQPLRLNDLSQVQQLLEQLKIEPCAMRKALSDLQTSGEAEIPHVVLTDEQVVRFALE